MSDNPNPRIGFRCPYCDAIIRVSRDVGRWRVKWREIDWEKPNRTLALAHKVSESYVAQQRRKYAPQTVGRVIKRRGDRDWQAVDWARSTGQIAAEMRITKGAVSAMRRKLAPETMSG